MIINIDAFNKKSNNIVYVEQDKLGGYRPIDLIAETNPVVIIDEPQSVMGTKGEDAVRNLNPLCTLRYSATHKEIQNLVYKLDAVDASEQELVKQIEVAGFVSQGFHNDAYFKLESVNNKSSPITAKIEVDIIKNGSTKRKIVKVKQGTDLSEAKVTNNELYSGYIVDEIYCEEGNEYVTFTQKPEVLRIGKIFGDIDDLKLKRAQINKTIEEHLDKELRFAKSDKKIKVLSLFFIDKVANYRQYDEEGNPIKGPYAEMFEEEYKKVIQKPKYSTLYDYIDLDLEAEEAHDGYFSIDKKGRYKDSRENRSGKLRANKDDESAFNLIMKDKERLLSFDTKLKFIFSHSALREGWDNPNVFQICTLNETTSTMKKRQEIGRGLRLCVNQNGERIHDSNVNILTIMANESYEEFARKLQKEIEEDTGIKFKTIQENTFAHLYWTNKKGNYEPLGIQHSREIFKHFKLKNYIDKDGKIQEALKTAVNNNFVDVPKDYDDIGSDIFNHVKKLVKGISIKPRRQRCVAKLNKHIYLSDEFKEFWDSIKHKTTYSVEFDTEDLVKESVKAMKNHLNIKTPKLIFTKGGLTIDPSGINWENGSVLPFYSDDDEIALPDIVTFLQNETNLTRRTIVRILIESDTLNQFKKNPQEYMQETSKLINKVMSMLIVDGIKYTKIDEYYSQELFKNDELVGYFDKMVATKHHGVYDHIIWDSKGEMEFAQELDEKKEVKCFTKLPSWFRIDTPLGPYNPDWAIMFEKNNESKLYFVVETKGTTEFMGIRPPEQAKIDCGKKHFEALKSNVKFGVADTYKKFITDIVSD